jgi:hypothetical protein
MKSKLKTGSTKNDFFHCNSNKNPYNHGGHRPPSLI